jgi:hypothetical protein
MNNSSMRTASALVLILSAGLALGQNKPEVITVPLSRPGEPVSLKIDIPSARIEVIGEARQDAEFAITLAAGKRKLITPSGTKTLSGGSQELQVNEHDNTISVDVDSPVDRVEIIARIPRRADLDLSTNQDGQIIVRDVVGNLQLENTNGPISATSINGSVIAESVSEAIAVSFSDISSSGVTALSSLTGDISLSLPANAGVEMRIDTAKGQIDSDFEMEVKPSKPVIERKEGHDGVSVRVEDAIVATINGGGPVIRNSTLKGNIRISKSRN